MEPPRKTSGLASQGEGRCSGIFKSKSRKCQAYFRRRKKTDGAKEKSSRAKCDAAKKFLLNPNIGAPPYKLRMPYGKGDTDGSIGDLYRPKS